MNDTRSRGSGQHEPGVEHAPILTGVLPATAASVTELRHLILEFAREYGASRSDCDRIALAVTEAAANVVVHAYRPRQCGELFYLADIEDRDLQVIVSDDGEGISDRPRSPGLGVGLQLIAQMTVDFAITPRSPKGLDVWMRFLLDPGAGR
jgi:serine/threonine-protein kinase RsbW